MSEAIGQRFERAAERASYTKPFALSSTQVAGASNAALLKKHGDYKDAETLQQTCMMHAQAYSQTMMIRVLEE